MSDSHEPQITFIAPEPAALAPLFPGYEIEGLIATGGMGAVYGAIQKSLERTVAIKILPAEFSQDAAFCAGFEAEAKAMARLNHPNLIGVYDFGEVHGMLYIIMEFVPGKSIFHSAHGLAIDPDEVIRLVSGICHGLAHAHSSGIIHRDIKPSNILLDMNAQPKIGDFGLARPIGTKVQDGEEIFGTPHYTAPEVVSSPQSVDYRADIFSVGVLLHELLTGRLPADDPRPASVIVHCDPRFDAIIRRATDPLPERRYTSAAQIATELQALIQHSSGPRGLRNTPSAGPPQAVLAQTKKSKRKQSSESSGIGVLFAALLIGAAVYYLFFNHPPAPPAPPTPPLPADQPAESQPLPPEPHASSQLPAPAPEPVPTPETPPVPVPVPVPQPMPTPPTDSAANSGPNGAPEPAPTAAPKFDLDGFFSRARKIMKDKAAPTLAAYDANLVKNCGDFERSLKRVARKITSIWDQESAEKLIKQVAETCKTGKHRIPDPLTGRKNRIYDFEAPHAEFLEKQLAIDAATMKALSLLAPTYILGLEKQIERLKSDSDPSAVILIQDEITKTRDDPKYFPVLMLGYDPAAAPPASE